MHLPWQAPCPSSASVQLRPHRSPSTSTYLVWSSRRRLRRAMKRLLRHEAALSGYRDGGPGMVTTTPGVQVGGPRPAQVMTTHRVAGSRTGEAGAGPKGIGDGVKAGARVMSIVGGTSVVAIRTLIATMNTGRTTARRDKPRRAVAEQGLWAHAGNMPADAESSTASRRRQAVENANPWQPSQGLPARCLGRRFDIRPASRIAPTSKSAGWPQRCSRRGNGPRVPGASLRALRRPWA